MKILSQTNFINTFNRFRNYCDFMGYRLEIVPKSNSLLIKVLPIRKKFNTPKTEWTGEMKALRKYSSYIKKDRKKLISTISEMEKVTKKMGYSLFSKINTFSIIIEISKIPEINFTSTHQK